MSNNKDFKVKNGVKPTVYHEAVGTVVSAVEGYALASASYDSVSFSVGSQDLVPYGLTFNNDGTSMYVLGGVNNTVFQYTLSTAYDVSTASYASKSFSLSSQSGSAVGVAFNDTGTKMYISTTTPIVHQYDLSTAFDVITSVYNSVSLTVLGNPFDIIFNGDGSKLYVTDVNGSNVYQYSLSTAYDLSTGSYDNVSLSVVSRSNSENYGIAFNGSGTALFVSSGTNDTVDRYNLTTAYDLSTASYGNITFSVASQDTVPYKAKFSGNGTKMYMLGRVNASVFQYSTALNTASLDLSTGSVFEVTPTSDIQVTLSNPADSGTVSGATLLLDQQGYGGYDIANAVYDNKSFSVAGQESQPVLAFNNDGTKMYVAGNSSDSVHQYSLSTAFDLSTASYDSVSFSTSLQQPFGLAFNNSGTKMYVVDSNTDNIRQHSLSTSFDLSTASYDSISFNVIQDALPRGITFNNDGTKMYIVGDTNNRLYQYSLSTAFDLSTASYDSISFSFASQDDPMYTVSFNNDGTKMFALGIGSDNVYQYSLSTAYNISTASYDSVSFGVGTEDGSCYSVVFSNDGSKMFVSGHNTDTIYQYSTSTPATITYDPAIQWSAGTAPTAPAIGDTDVITFSTRDGGTTYSAALAIDGAA
jgi:DNA-binding beta-propeller fold protein YncE